MNRRNDFISLKHIIICFTNLYEAMTMTFKLYKYIKNRGFTETLETLASFEGNKAVQKVFFDRFEKEQSYYNSYLIVKDILLEENLIAFELNEEFEKVIKLTEKGQKIWKILEEIEEILA